MGTSKKQIRENFRKAVFERDGNTCVFCSSKDCLDAHHIINRELMPNGGYILENGITVCSEHHILVEDAYWNNPSDPKYGPDALYKLIKDKK